MFGSQEVKKVTEEQRKKQHPTSIAFYNEKLTPEERSQHGVKAGKASGEARRKYRSQKEILTTLSTMDVDDPKTREALIALGLDPTFANAMAIAQYRKAAVIADGDAARYVRDTLGERPTDRKEIHADVLDLSSLSTEELLAMVADEVADEDAESPETL